MTISKEGDTVWTVVPQTVGGGNVETISCQKLKPISCFSQTPCAEGYLRDTTTRFIVTLPVSITSQFDVSDGYTYEAFLLGIKKIEGIESDYLQYPN